MKIRKVDYCCEGMRLALCDNVLDIRPTGKIVFQSSDVRGEITHVVAYCPYCGEKIEVIDG